MKYCGKIFFWKMAWFLSAWLA